MTSRRRSLLRELMIEPLLSQRSSLYGIVTSLIVLGVSQGLFLLMVKGFIKALFTDAHRQMVPIAELLPAKVITWWPSLAQAQVANASLAVIVPLAILAAGLAKSLASYLYQLHQQALALYLAKTYREKLFRALIGLPYSEIVKRQVGAWMSLIMNDVMLLQTRFTDIMTGLIKDSVATLSCYVVLAIIHWPSALVIFCLSPFIAFGMGRTGKRIARYAEIYQRELGRMAATILDLRSRFDFIRACQGEKREGERFAELNQSYYAMIKKSILVRSAFAPVLEFAGFGVFALSVVAIGKGYWGHFTPDLMMQFFVALGLLLRPLREMGEQISRYHETRGTLLDSLAVFDLLAAKTRSVLAPDGAAPPAAGVTAGAAALAALAEANATASVEALPGAAAAGATADAGAVLGVAKVGAAAPFASLRIDAMQAGMAGEVRFAATGLQLVAGRAVAVVGPSGAGKSTFIKTLAGLVEPLAWQANLTWREATQLVSMVSQEPFLFADTVEANLVYGLAAASRPTAAAIHAALATVNIDHEVQAMPEGLATPLRAIGSNVSGGQLQRLVIARALMRGKPIWLLDEATSAVDARSEKDITIRLIEACHATGRALVAVTHRLTWLDAFDEVWFIEHGGVALAGPHQQLLADPRYRSYCAAAARE